MTLRNEWMKRIPFIIILVTKYDLYLTGLNALNVGEGNCKSALKVASKRQRKTLAFNVKIKESPICCAQNANRSGWGEGEEPHSFCSHWHSLFSTDSFHIHYPFTTFVAINVSEWSDGLFKNTQEFRKQKDGKAISCLTCREWGQKEPFTVC